MGVRHPVLLSLWGLMIGAVALSVTNLAWFSIALFGTPFVGIATLSVVFRRRDPEPFAPGWTRVYRAAAGLLLVAAAIGLVAAAGRVVRHGSGSPGLQVGPAGLLFLLAFVLGWRALVGPTALRAAIVGMVVHLLWVPILIIDLAMGIGRHGSVPAHPQLWGAALLGVVALSAAMSMLALVAFAGASSLVPARAREGSGETNTTICG